MLSTTQVSNRALFNNPRIGFSNLDSAVILPCYNEEAAIAAVVAGF